MDSSPDYKEIEKELTPPPDYGVEAEPSILDLAYAEKYFSPYDYEVIETKHQIWVIDNWSSLPDKIHGPAFICGDHQWRALLFPRGNSVHSDSTSLYAEVTPPENSSEDWAICAQFLLIIANKEDPSIHARFEAKHRFNKTEVDWGYSKLLDQRTLLQPFKMSSRPLIENDSVLIGLYVRVFKDPTGYLWSNYANYDSKKATGYVGLLNQGATCYMNSLLQSFYFTNYFRKEVFKIPTENDDPNNSIALALQRIFYQLQKSNTAVGTNELTKSFGWTSMDSFMQHDVQEFNRVLQDNLEGKMKGTAAEGAIQRLFVGKMKSYITCTDVEYESSRTEDFYDIQLNVKGCKNVRESFENYVEVEILEGDNKYMAEGHGLQDAKKGVIFESFPPVLHLQLKRFDYDFMRDAMVKINDRYEFPPSIDLSDFLSEDADRSEPYEYDLHGVLVHSGDLHAGHYFALLKPTPDGKWYKFDDDRVTFATNSEVFEENFGADTKGITITPGMRPNQRLLKKFSNAYMLVYIRKSRLSSILSEVKEEDFPQHLVKRFNSENEANLAANKKKSELGLQVQFQVITDEHIRHHHGFGVLNHNETYCPQSPFQNVIMRKDQTLSDLRECLMEKYDLRPNQFRLWSIVNRENRTLRVSHIIPESEDLSALSLVKDKYFGDRSSAVIYLEETDSIIPYGSDLPSIKDSNPVLIMIKYFDIDKKELNYLGKFYADKSTRFSEIARQLNNYMGFDEDTRLELFDEIKPNLIEPISLNITIELADITSGDIVCFQKASTSEFSDDINPETITFFENLNNRVQVAFKPKGVMTNINHVDFEKDIILDLNKKMTYNEFVGILANKLQADPEKIRLHSPNGIRSLLTTPVNYDPNVLLENLLRFSLAYNTELILYYEILDVTLKELESKVPIVITLLDGNTKDEHEFNILAPKEDKLNTAFDLFLQKLKETGSDINIKELRFYEADHSRFNRVLSGDEYISDISPHSNIYAETLNQHNQVIDEDDVLVPVLHFNKDETRTFGIPFLVVRKKLDTFDSFKLRLVHRLGITEKELAKYKFSKISGTSYYNARSEYFEEDQWDTIEFSESHHLGLDHPDRNAKSNRFAEKAIKIFN